MNNNKVTAKRRGGIGFAEVLTIVFIVLKLIGVIEWSWLWVLSPLWITVIMVVVLVSIIHALNWYDI